MKKLSTKLTRSVALVAIVIGALSPLEIANANIITSGLIGYWAGDNNATDSSSMANNGSFSGNYVAGVNGQAFDLSTAKVSIPDNPAYSFGAAFSVGFWFNVNGASTNSVVFIGQDEGGGSTNKWFIDYNYSNPSKFEFHVNGPSSAFIPSDSVTLSSGWNQLTFVKDNSNYSFFLNGSGIGGGTFGGAFPDPNYSLIFGQAEGNFNFNGLMDDVVLYNRALTGSEVQSLTTVSAVPEPESYLLFSIGLLGILVIRNQRA